MTRIADLLAAGRTTSFEFFPPKNEEMERALEKCVAEVAELQPDFVSVTYGALGSNRERTRDAVIRINSEQAYPAMPHLTCVGHTRADIDSLLDQYAAAGIENILALGGDPPADGSTVSGDFEYACELLEVVRAHPAGFSVGVAAHPEVHPRSPDRDSDRRHLAAKLADADFAMTQFFFTPDHYFRLVDELAALGVEKPVLPGIMPIASVAGVKRMAGMNGTDIPTALLDRLEAVADQPEEVRKIGVECAIELSAALLEGGVPGLHLYTLNRSESVREVLAGL